MTAPDAARRSTTGSAPGWVAGGIPGYQGHRGRVNGLAFAVNVPERERRGPSPLLRPPWMSGGTAVSTVVRDRRLQPPPVRPPPFRRSPRS